MTQKPPVGKLWGIVLAGEKAREFAHFLQRLCGNRGIKQFCALVDSRSMLEHTLARVERVIPRQRILVVVSRQHRQEVTEQLAHWPKDNVIFQPANCETGPGILLPLAHLSQRDPLATVAVFPSDHFIKDEDLFVACLRKAITETKQFPEELVLLGVTPDKAEEGYGWIEPREADAGWESRRVKRFWEKPSSMQAQVLLEGELCGTPLCFLPRQPRCGKWCARLHPISMRLSCRFARRSAVCRLSKSPRTFMRRCDQLTSPPESVSHCRRACVYFQCQRLDGVIGEVLNVF